MFEGKGVLLFKKLEHAHQVSAEIVFAGKSIHSREVIDALVGLHSLELFRGNSSSIAPVDVPISILIICLFEA